MPSDVLLESGTNELELLEFKIGGNCYGINVAKIKEILPHQKVTPVPNAHPCVEGIFMPRDMLITLINLAESLNLPPSSNPSTDMFIVTRFNNLTIAFHAHSVEGIHRISWKDITKPDETINDHNSVATGIVKIDNRLIIMLDFEKIITDINPNIGIRDNIGDAVDKKDRSGFKILMAEDSAMLAKIIKECLTKAGYNNIVRVNNGLEAWKILEEKKTTGDIDEYDCVITDIEMPVMDGHHLTKLIKTDNDLAKLPVIVFSSIVNDEMRKKSASLGADAQLSKPEIGLLVDTMDKFLLKE